MNRDALQRKITERLTQRQEQLLEQHLRRRMKARGTRPGVSIVYDIVRECNLQCKGCSVFSSYVDRTEPIPRSQLTPPVEQIVAILKKIRRYAAKSQKTCFVNFGGGEPFLRSDLGEIVRKAAEFFGPTGVGIDTNGTVDGQAEVVASLAPFFSYLGVSLDGLQDYHDWWRDGHIREGAFNRTVSLLKELVKNTTILDKLEVTSVATRLNLEQLPQLMEFLHGIGIKRYSIHRAMAVGRMEERIELIPDARDYLNLLVAVCESAEKLGLDVHIHHSIESIYATLLIGLETYSPNKLGNPDAGSSLGIEIGGTVVFDPWSTSGPWRKVSAGSLLDPETEINAMLESNEGTLLDLAKQYTASHVRCNGCAFPCSGGNRIAAAAQFLQRHHGSLTPQQITESHVLHALTAIDPACPLYQKHS